jgi:uncharacterized protein (TIGR02001 family)
VLVLVSVLAPPPAGAADWGGSLAATSDYVFRGYSRSDGEAAVQAGLYGRHAERWFASAWVSSLHAAPEGPGRIELNLQAGRSWDLSDDWGATVGLVRYLYPDAPAQSRFDWTEAAASLAFADRLVLTYAVAPQAPYVHYGTVERWRTTALEASGRLPVSAAWSLLAAAGRYGSAAPYGETYKAWNVGVAAQWGTFEVTWAHFRTDAAGRRVLGPAAADGRWVLSAVWRYAGN